MNITNASRDGFTEIVKEYIKTGDDVNKVKHDGWTALMHASFHGNIEIVKELLRCRSIDVNKVNDDGWTALMHASLNGHSEIVNLLIKAGADINKQSTSGWTALICASLTGYKEIVKVIKEKMLKDIMTSKCLLLPYDIVHKIVIEMI